MSEETTALVRKLAAIEAKEGCRVIILRGDQHREDLEKMYPNSNVLTLEELESYSKDGMKPCKALEGCNGQAGGPDRPECYGDCASYSTEPLPPPPPLSDELEQEAKEVKQKAKPKAKGKNQKQKGKAKGKGAEKDAAP